MSLQVPVHSFWLLRNIPLHAYAVVHLFIPQMSGFQFLKITNTATMNSYSFLCEHKFSFHLSKYLGVKCLGCIGSVYINYKKLQNFSKER